MLALEWSDIDFDNDVITVSKSVGYSKGQQFIKVPKTRHSFRKVTIPHFLTLRIKAKKTERLRYRLSVGDYWQGGEWLFVQENGSLMNYSSPYQAFHDSIIRYNECHDEKLPVIPLHGLRHPHVKHTTKINLCKSRNPKLSTFADSLGLLLWPIAPARSAMPVPVWSVFAVAFNYSGLIR